MRNIEEWRPSKLVYSSRKQRYVPHRTEVWLGSQLTVAAQAEPYARLVREHAQGRLLDCGCGKVPFFDLYRDRVSSVVCIDWNDAGHADLTVDLGGNLPFSDDSFETVLLSDVLEHVVDPARLMAEIARVLAPGGKLILTVPFYYWVHEAPHDYHRFTRFALEKLARDGGLRVSELTPYGGYPDVVLDLLNKGLAKKPMVCRMFLGAAGWTTRTKPYRKLRARTAERFPLGYCLVATKA
jgi:SAM-dependent methyltransferase